MYKGNLLANVFTTNKIVKLDPVNGKLLATYDMSHLESDVNSSEGYE